MVKVGNIDKANVKIGKDLAFLPKPVMRWNSRVFILLMRSNKPGIMKPLNLKYQKASIKFVMELKQKSKGH